MMPVTSTCWPWPTVKLPVGTITSTPVPSPMAGSVTVNSIVFTISVTGPRTVTLWPSIALRSPAVVPVAASTVAWRPGAAVAAMAAPLAAVAFRPGTAVFAAFRLAAAVAFRSPVLALGAAGEAAEQATRNAASRPPAIRSRSFIGASPSSARPSSAPGRRGPHQGDATCVPAHQSSADGGTKYQGKPSIVSPPSTRRRGSSYSAPSSSSGRVVTALVKPAARTSRATAGV